MDKDLSAVSQIHNDRETILARIRELLGFSGNDRSSSEELIGWLCDELIKTADNPKYKNIPIKLWPA